MNETFEKQIWTADGRLLRGLEADAARSGERLSVSRKKGAPPMCVLKRATPVEPYELTPEQTFHFLTRVLPERIPPCFMKLVARVLFNIGWPEIAKVTMRVGPTRSEPFDGRGLAFFIQTGKREGLVVVQNFTMRCIWVDITMNRRVSKVEPFGFYRMPPTPAGDHFDLRVAVQGVVLARVAWQKSRQGM